MIGNAAMPARAGQAALRSRLVLLAFCFACGTLSAMPLQSQPRLGGSPPTNRASVTGWVGVPRGSDSTRRASAPVVAPVRPAVRAWRSPEALDRRRVAGAPVRQADTPRAHNTLRAAVIGAAIGGVLGYVLTEQSCSACDDPAPLYAGAVVGAGAGALLGILISRVR